MTKEKKYVFDTLQSIPIKWIFPQHENGKFWSFDDAIKELEKLKQYEEEKEYKGKITLEASSSNEEDCFYICRYKLETEEQQKIRIAREKESKTIRLTREFTDLTKDLSSNELLLLKSIINKKEAESKQRKKKNVPKID